MQTKRTHRSITRSTVAAGNLLAIKKPEFISLVAAPANQKPFSVIRSEDGGKTTKINRTPRTARRGVAQEPPAASVKRDESGILVITFPADYKEEDAVATIETFGLSGYTLSLNGNHYVATRSDVDLQSVANSKNQIRVTSDGVTLTMDEDVYTAPEHQPVEGVAVVAYEFNKKTFDETSVLDWISKNSIDIAKDAAQNSDDVNISVQRREVEEGTEVRRIEVEAGVVAVIARSESYDVPEASIGVVEAAYGGWGWGQMDFMASMADDAFCSAFDRAMGSLSSVLRRIVYYSELPLDLRKTLVSNATSQFAAFVNGAIDALPRQVLLLQAVRSDADHQPEESHMNTAEQAAKAEEVKRAEAEAAAAKQAEEDAKPVTRGELAALITAGIQAALPATQAAKEETVARSESSEETNKAAVQSESITRSDLTAAFADAIKPVMERMDKLESTTVVRDTGGDAKQVEKPAPKKQSVFRGAFLHHNDQE